MAIFFFFLDEWLSLCADTFFHTLPNHGFATILSATEMTKIDQNNPFFFSVATVTTGAMCIQSLHSH